ncbi:MAG TPA: SDR family NAD(P)-dependent oxidoreductase, partial [Myxococcota bacterium]
NGAVGARIAEQAAAALVRRGAQAVVCTPSSIPASAGSLLDLSAVDVDDSTAVVALKAGLFTLQKMGAALRANNGRAVVVTAGGGRFASVAGVKGAAVLGLSGLVKTARQEWTDADIRLVDVDLGNAGNGAIEIIADSLAVQMTTTSKHAEIGVQGSTLVTPTEVDAPIAAAASKLVAGDVVVITGGARGVTATCALALTKQVHGLKLAILQRTVVDGAEPAFARSANDEGSLKRAILADAAARGTSVPLREVAKLAQNILAAREVRQTIAELAQRAEVELFACDVQNDASVGAALDNVRRRFGRVDVIVHGAGVLADKRIEDKTAEQVDKVVDTKVLGLLALMAHTSSDNLKGLIVFSSVAGRFGNVGQVDYAMANEAMTRLLTVEKKKRPALIAKALHWGPWEGGMVTPELKAQFASRGITVIERDDGSRAFVAELSTAASDDVEIVLGASLAVSHDDASGSAGNGNGGGNKSTTPTAAKHTSSVHISAQTMPFLADHAVKGDVVLPVVVAIDLIASAAATHHHAQVRTVHDVEMVKGQRLPRFATSGHGADVTLVTARPTPTGVQVAAELRVDGVLAYRAVVELSDELEVTPPASRTLPPMSAPAFTLPLYSGSGGNGLLFHGPHFQLIEHLDGVDDMAVVARVQSTRGAGWAGRFTVDVAALDAGLQLLLLWARHRTGGAFLPTRVGAVTQHTLLLPRGPLTSVVEAA